MCGIAGIIDLSGTREIDRHMIKRMTDALAHRGPDGHGFHLEPGIGFGHRRLSIIDIEGGAQPFTSSAGETVLTFNGEIYNHQDLAHDLRAKGRNLRTRCDTEIIAELVDLRGAEALSSFNGMFAFAAFSPRSQTFLLARDRLGEKPLYYTQTDDGYLLFASEIDALLASGIVPAIIDDEAVSEYLFYGYVPDPKSIYRHIHKLPPGHFLSFKRGQPLGAPRAWWSLNIAPDDQMRYEDAVEALIPLLDRAVGDQMLSDMPIAAFLSGGVDSSAIVSAMTKFTDAPITTCAMGFDDPKYDERGPAAQIAELFGTNHKSAEVSFEAATLLPIIASVYGEPFADTSALPTLLLCGLAREHASVALSGDGGDEIFAGYNRYSGVMREAQMRRMLPSALRKNVIAPLGNLYPALHSAPKPLRLRTALQSIGEGQAAGYARAVSAVLPDQVSAMLAPSLRSYRPQSVIERIISQCNTDDPVLQAQAADMATWLPGRMLVKVDRASMASSLEVRPPLLDYHLVEWAATLPRAFKTKDGIGKRVFKDALSPSLPQDILHRPKQGFGAPVDRWFADKNGQLMKLLRNQESWQDSGYFNVDHVLSLAKAHADGTAKHGQALWSVLLFDAFLTRTPKAREDLPMAVLAARTSSHARNVA